MDTRGEKKSTYKNRKKVWHSKGASPSSHTVCGCHTCVPRSHNKSVYRLIMKTYIKDIEKGMSADVFRYRSNGYVKSPI